MISSYFTSSGNGNDKQMNHYAKFYTYLQQSTKNYYYSLIPAATDGFKEVPRIYTLIVDMRAVSTITSEMFTTHGSKIHRAILCTLS